MKESDELSQQRLEELRLQIAEKRQQVDGLNAQWANAKGAADRVQELKRKIDDTKIEEERATREGDLMRASELRYGIIPKLELELEEATAQVEAGKDGASALKEEVTA